MHPSKRKKTEKDKTVLAAAQSAMQQIGRPQSAAKILSVIKSRHPDIQITEDGLEYLLDIESDTLSTQIQRHIQGRLKRYSHSSGENTVIDEKEQSLYSPFCSLLKERGWVARPLDHTKARKGRLGENHWRYPDIVACRPAIKESGVANLAGKTGSFNQDTVIAYELKNEVSAGNIRSAFFECLSNSFWANERYVAAPEISAEAVEVFRTLGRRYPVGLIEIDRGKLGELKALKFLVECPRTALDVEALEELRSDWEDLADFIKLLNH